MCWFQLYDSPPSQGGGRWQNWTSGLGLHGGEEARLVRVRARAGRALTAHGSRSSRARERIATACERRSLQLVVTLEELDGRAMVSARTEPGDRVAAAIPVAERMADP